MDKCRHIVFSLLIFISCQPDKKTTYCDVLVIGEGTGAVSAAIQSARSGAKTILVNPLPWLGGMLTSAGVSAVDGNHQMPAGLWGEFRQHLRDHYGGTDSLATGWVSHTLFEPHVGAKYWQQMADNEGLLTIRKMALWSKIDKKKNWNIEVILENGETEKIRAKILIDGTDLGDVAATAGATYDLGMDSRSVTGEVMAPEFSNDIVQDLTYVAILKDFGDSVDMTISQPTNYDPSLFYCSCKKETEQINCGDEKPHPCLTMLNYAKLPNNKYMLNWPLHGNDYYANVSEMNPTQRDSVFQKAKEKTLQFVYYIQQELGFSNLGLADDEFPTKDKLALMPYHREGRRIHGEVRMTVNHILKPYSSNLFKTGIAVGDYPIDHHHKERPGAPEIDFPKVPAFNIPMGCLIPINVDHLLIADKAISVTNIANGSSRLQPVIIQVGQAAGLMAAICANNNISPKEINVQEVQNKLLATNGYLMPFIDIEPADPHFNSVQRVAASGILKGRGVPYKWANQTWFDVDSTILVKEFIAGLQMFDENFIIRFKSDRDPLNKKLTIGGALSLIDLLDRTINTDKIDEHWFKKNNLINFELNRPITKKELAVLIDNTIDPFNFKEVDLNGNQVKIN